MAVAMGPIFEQIGLTHQKLQEKASRVSLVFRTFFGAFLPTKGDEQTGLLSPPGRVRPSSCSWSGAPASRAYGITLKKAIIQGFPCSVFSEILAENGRYTPKLVLYALFSEPPGCVRRASSLRPVYLPSERAKIPGKGRSKASRAEHFSPFSPKRKLRASIPVVYALFPELPGCARRCPCLRPVYLF
jgi:hypothetical protein